IDFAYQAVYRFLGGLVGQAAPIGVNRLIGVMYGGFGWGLGVVGCGVVGGGCVVWWVGVGWCGVGGGGGVCWGGGWVWGF
ncbi:hypothetical protein, partial [Pseudomonas syringae group genomosp. 7]|uniref:hypothetical protein n=1 Tax=Pseudomonas syringae group genomosp. 7 TaxID=251699 RepID=UPI00376FF80C